MKATKAERFKIQTFTNRGDSVSWRVSGSKRDGTRVRENFSVEHDAKLRRIDLEAEYHKGDSDTTLRATKLSHEQIQLAEVACIKLGDDWTRLLDAVDKWIKDGKQAPAKESPRIDEAAKTFNDWLDEKSGFRDRTLSNLKARLNVFVNSVPNLRVSDITADRVFEYLGKRDVAKATKDNDRRALSRFFAWCIHRDQKYITTNPARKESRERRRDKETLPHVLTVTEAQKLLRAAEHYKKGRLLPYVALCLFGGFRPDEAARLTKEQINLSDREIALQPWQSKTGTSRVVKICNTLAAWLKAAKGRELYPSNWRKDFAVIKREAGYGPKLQKVTLPNNETKEIETGLKEWPVDVMRHTAISHYFRKSLSFGATAEQFGNSEAVIKKHYKGLVSTEDMKKFYALRPKKGGRK